MSSDEPTILETDSLVWQDLSICQGLETNMFYDKYEKSPTMARIVDEICLSCPVLKECGLAGVDGNEIGVWGGVFLDNGVPRQDRNSHKSPEVWQRIRERYAAV